jgi:hypothetical protein
MADELDRLLAHAATQDPWGDVSYYDWADAIRSHVAAMVAAERERCARVCERLAGVAIGNHASTVLWHAAAEIRRGDG